MSGQFRKTGNITISILIIIIIIKRAQRCTLTMVSKQSSCESILCWCYHHVIVIANHKWHLTPISGPIIATDPDSKVL